MSPRSFTLDDKNVTRILWPLKDVVSNITLFFFANENSAFEFLHTKKITKISYGTMFYKSLKYVLSSRKNCKLMRGTEGVIII